MAKVIVLKDFTDRLNKKRHLVDSEIEVTDDRALELEEKGFVSLGEKSEKNPVKEKAEHKPAKEKAEK
jgi:hypothetical protein